MAWYLTSSKKSKMFPTTITIINGNCENLHHITHALQNPQHLHHTILLTWWRCHVIDEEIKTCGKMHFWTKVFMSGNNKRLWAWFSSQFSQNFSYNTPTSKLPRLEFSTLLLLLKDSSNHEWNIIKLASHNFSMKTKTKHIAKKTHFPKC
jgi:hypothetical protein